MAIVEDPTLDRHIVLPVLERACAEAGLRAKWVGPDATFRAEQVLKPECVQQLVDEWAFVDLFVLCVDRDCNRRGHDEKAAARVAEHPGKLVAVVAWQEVEVWMLALHAKTSSAVWKDVPWSEVRAHCDPKEAFAEPFLDGFDTQSPGRGRKAAMRDFGAAEWKQLLARCPEVEQLVNDLRAFAARHSRSPK